MQIKKTTKWIKDCFHCLKSNHVKKTAKFPTKIKGKSKPRKEKITKRFGEIRDEKADNIKLASTKALNV